MAASNNQFNIDFDFPGLCASCHNEIAEFNGFNIFGTPIITKLKGNFRTMRIELDDGSGMTITVCKDCTELSPEDMGPLMESLINGLIVEIQRRPNFEHKKRTDIDSISKRFITQRIDKPFKQEEVRRITKPDKENLKRKA